MAGLLGVVHYGDTRKAHSLGAARSPYFAILNNKLQIPFPLKLTSDPTSFHRRIEVKGIGHASTGQLGHETVALTVCMPEA